MFLRGFFRSTLCTQLYALVALHATLCSSLRLTLCAWPSALGFVRSAFSVRLSALSSLRSALSQSALWAPLRLAFCARPSVLDSVYSASSIQLSALSSLRCGATLLFHLLSRTACPAKYYCQAGAPLLSRFLSKASSQSALFVAPQAKTTTASRIDDIS